MNKFSVAALSSLILLQACQPVTDNTTDGKASQPQAAMPEGLSAQQQADMPEQLPAEHYLLTSKTPYQPQQQWQQYSQPPSGFNAVSVQHVARHGSRFLSSRGDDDLMLQLLQLAGSEQALTPLGQELAQLIERLHQAHQPDKYGEISGSGEQEHQQMAARLLERQPEVFAMAVAQQQRIAVLHSGRERADQSGDAFISGLTTLKPELSKLIDTARADEATLYFYKAEGSEAFERYRKSDPRLQAVMQQLESQPKLQQAATAMLQPFFTPAFITRLENGEFELTLVDDDDAIRNVLDAANVLYSLYSIASNLAVEGDFDFSRFLQAEHLLPLAELDDADSFYGRGPAFAGDDVTYNLAGRLVQDMLNKAEQPNGYVATFRFTHAQVMMPLAAYLGITGASEPLPESVTYSYQTSNWRSGKVSPMAANVQWEVFRNTEGTVLIRMLHNEQETRFNSACQPYADTQYFYTTAELKGCLLH